jgi:hypothetical protein
MTFRVVRDKVAWVALGSAINLFILDWYSRGHYWRINEHGYGETTTPVAVLLLWLLLVLLTFLSSIVSFLRWQSFVALLCLGWIVLMTMQGHWP